MRPIIPPDVPPVSDPVIRQVVGPIEIHNVELGVTGAQLWRELTSEKRPDPLQRVLVLEACRIADRLDTLDRQLNGESWLRFRHDESGAEVTVYVDRVLAEAREQATALRGIVAELTKAGRGRPPKQETEKTKGGGVLADLAARRASRSAQATS